MMAMMTAMEDVTVAKEAIKVSNESSFPYFSVKKTYIVRGHCICFYGIVGVFLL